MQSSDELQAALEWQRDGFGVAIATVVKTWGSAPRPAGSHLAVRQDAHFLGSVSGGCVEGKVIEAALETIDCGSPQLLEFGVSNPDAWEAGLACGGRIVVRVEALDKDYARLQAARIAKRPVAWVGPVSGVGAIDLVFPSDDHPFQDQVRDSLRADRVMIFDEENVHIRPYNPPLTMILIGAVHIAQHLAEIARQVGYEVIVVDPRTAFGSAARFSDVQLIDDWPDDALNELELDTRTAVVTLTHDPKLDDPALTAALNSDAFYIGALGSKKTHANRRGRLLRKGFSEAQVDRVHGPVGLDIGARSPAEIAISILAEITQELRIGSGR